MEGPPNNSKKDEEKTSCKRYQQKGSTSPTNEVQNKVTNQNHELDKLCSFTEKLFTIMVQNQSPLSKNYVDERKHDMCNQSSEET